jgi:hypothetical protein
LRTWASERIEIYVNCINLFFQFHKLPDDEQAWSKRLVGDKQILSLSIKRCDVWVCLSLDSNENSVSLRSRDFLYLLSDYQLLRKDSMESVYKTYKNYSVALLEAFPSCHWSICVAFYTKSLPSNSSDGPN